MKELEALSHAAKRGDRPAVEKALKDALAAAQSAPEELRRELEIWQGKLDVIWSEPVGRQGLVKHIHHWIEKLKA